MMTKGEPLRKAVEAGRLRDVIIPDQETTNILPVPEGFDLM